MHPTCLGCSSCLTCGYLHWCSCGCGAVNSCGRDIIPIEPESMTPIDPGPTHSAEEIQALSQRVSMQLSGIDPDAGPELAAVGSTKFQSWTQEMFELRSSLGTSRREVRQLKYELEATVSMLRLSGAVSMMVEGRFPVGREEIQDRWSKEIARLLEQNTGLGVALRRIISRIEDVDEASNRQEALRHVLAIATDSLAAAQAK